MRLSICIPTYNRAVELRPLLDTIVAQTGHGLDVEIVISDNASTDNTPAVVAEYAAVGVNIVYSRLEQNRGFDRNILNAVASATGDFCWLFGSDDIFEASAFARIERVVATHPTLTGISVGSRGYTHDLSKRAFVHDHISTDFAIDTVLIGRAQIIGTIGAWLGYMSSIVVRRSGWEAALAAAPIEPYLKGYVHTYLIAKMLSEESIWLCVPDTLVGCRLGNESFLARDEFARTRVDIVGYDLAFGDTLGRGHRAYRRAMSDVASFYVRTHFLGAKLKGASMKYWKEAIPMSIAYYWRLPRFWLRTIPIAITPAWILLVARTLYRKSVKARIEQRRVGGQ
ncbi:glycosyltransferase family 2 protein [Sphingomonas sp. Ant H11]|uniref:glycosyltransferase family 2 protein n=1 Tax=Sphingomonas sp. Ant H11 TaxID=1564113 RepID=UPI000ABCEE63|nr:glycosyltransferase family 2 protein [Sphingomonas sp. Ant H11]